MRLLQLYLSLCNPMDCSLPVSSGHGVLQARILEWVAISSPRDQAYASYVYLLWQAGSLPLEQPFSTVYMNYFSGKKNFFLRLCFSTSFQCSLLKVFVVGVCTTPEKVWLFLSLTVFRLAVPKLIKQKTTNRDFPAVNEGGSVAFVSKSSRFSNGQTEHNSFLCR